MLKSFLIVLAALIVIPTILWGFPGVWALLALVPAFILGATIAHLRAPRDEGRAFRPGVIVLGGVFGLITGTAAVLFMWASSAPEQVVIRESVTVAATPETVWKLVTDVGHRAGWETWMTDIEAIGLGDLAVGSRFRSTLHMERMQQSGIHRVTELEPGQRMTWTIEPQGGAWRVENVVESIALAPAEGGTRVEYEIRYGVPSVFGRVLERVVVRQSFRKVAETSLDILAGAAVEQ